MICLQIAFVLAYAASGYGFNPYHSMLYRNAAIVLEVADLLVIFYNGTMSNVLKRGYYKNFVVTVKHALIVGALMIAYLFVLQEGQNYSRLSLILMIPIYAILTYLVRELWKHLLRKQMDEGTNRSLLIIAAQDNVHDVVRSMKENNFARYMLSGVAVIDADWSGNVIEGIPVVAARRGDTVLCRSEWIDEVLIVLADDLPYPNELIRRLTETGVTIHLNLAKVKSEPGKKFRL